MLQAILLEPEQKELLSILVEASRNVTREDRQEFYAYGTMGTKLAHLLRPGLPKQFPGAYMGDIKILGGQGLISLLYGTHGTLHFDVAPIGFAYYAELKRSQDGPVERIEQTTRQFLDSHDFRSRYPGPYDKWAEAESLVWAGDTEHDLTIVGHLSRESLQLFAASLVEAYKPSGVDPDVAHVVSRIRAVLASTPSPSQAERAFLDALVAYWGTVSDLVQRQEHGAQKENAELVWEDARRVVFHTAVLMFEVDRALRRNR